MDIKINSIYGIDAVKTTQCNLQLMRLLQKTGKQFYNTKRKQTKAGIHLWTKEWLTFFRIYKWLLLNAQGTKRIWLWEQDKTTRCPMVVSKLIQSTDAFCASTTLKQTVLRASLRATPSKNWATRLVAQKTAPILSVAKFAFSNTLWKY